MMIDIYLDDLNRSQRSHFMFSQIEEVNSADLTSLSYMYDGTMSTAKAVGDTL